MTCHIVESLANLMRVKVVQNFDPQADSPLVRTSDKRAPRVGDRATVLLALVVSRVDRQEIRSDTASASIQPLLAASTLMAVTTGLTNRVTRSTPNQQMA